VQTCSVEGCGKEAKVRGFCKSHYVRQWKKEQVSIEKREGNELYNVWCSKRKDRVPEWDSFEQFKKDMGAPPSPQHRLWRKDKTKPHGPGNVEWRLTFAPMKEGESLKEYSKRAIRIHRLRLQYGITREQYDQMLAAQNGGCAICSRPETAVINGKVMELAVDHDHKTGKVRALLCSTCNTSLGGFQDSPALLQKAIEYLKEHSDGVEEANDD
jgi:Recombination endonuclease VII